MTRARFLGGSNDNRSVQVDALRLVSIVAERAATAGMISLPIDAARGKPTGQVHDDTVDRDRPASRDKYDWRR